MFKEVNRKRFFRHCRYFINGPFLSMVEMRLLVLLAALFLTNIAFAQDDNGAPRRGSRVIDDTTKSVYGPKTSRYYYENDVFLNRDVFHPVDTVIRNFHQFNDVQRNENLYQDLGIIGSAIRPIYYEVPDVIGVSSGFSSYDVYWNREQIRYWDTKSPYSNMNVILGGKGRSITRATYSRNISPGWNFGLTYRGLFIDKQIAKTGKGDRFARSQYYDFFTTYQSKDSTYRIFANFRRNKHEVAEYGGVRTDLANFLDKDFFDTNAERKLERAVSNELRMNIHLFHQYSLGRGLQIYHKLDRYRQSNAFTGRPFNELEGYYDYFELNRDTTDDRSKFKFLRNEAGIKGSLAKLYYNGYYALRNYNMEYPYDSLLIGAQKIRKGTESYLGGRVGLYLYSLLEIRGWAEIMQNGNYRIEGSVFSKWAEASLKQVQYEPSFLSQYYRSNHDFWQRNYSSINTTQLRGFLHYRSKVLTLSPGVTFTRIGNYVFFKSAKIEEERVGTYTSQNLYQADVIPVQSSGDQVIVSPMMKLDLTVLKHIHLRGFGIFTKILEESEDALDIPELFVNGQLSYENIFFNDNLDMHAGVDVHWKSRYYAMGYDVPTQQYYIQGMPDEAGLNDNLNTPFMEPGREGRFTAPSFPLIDVFFNAKIKRGRIFFRYNNVLQLITGEGYFPTPFYPGQRNSIDFGFDWSFYD